MYRLKYTGALSALVFLFLLILIIYSNTFDAAWHLDDYQNITQNPHFDKIKNLNVSTLWASLHSPVNQRISRPVAMLSFALNWYIGSNHVFGYHFVNLLIHLLTAFFLYLTIVNLFKAPNLKDQISGKRRFYCTINGRTLGDSSHSDPGGNLHCPADGMHGRHVLYIKPLLFYKSQAGTT